jgi:hypothetical protein
MLFLNNVLKLINILFIKDKLATDFILLLKVILLHKRNKKVQKLKKSLNINKVIISDKLLWSKILLDKQALKPNLILELCRLIVKPSKGY